MTLRYVDSYAYLPADNTNTTVTNDKLDAGGSFVVPGIVDTAYARVTADGAFGATCLRYDNGIGFTSATFDKFEVVKPFLNEGSAGFLGRRLFIESAHNLVGAKPYVAFYDCVTGLRLVTVSLDNYGVVHVYQGNSFASGDSPAGTLLGSSRPGSWYKNEWFYIEVRLLPGSGDGEVEVRINTEPVINLIAQDTGGGAANGQGYGAEGPFDGGGGLAQIRMRTQDVYACDDFGVVNNGFLGNVRAIWLATAGAGAATDLARAGPAATNWQAASNQAITDAGGYVYSATPGDEDLYTLNPVLGGEIVHGVQMRVAARMDDATQRVAHTLFRIGGSVAESDDHYVNQTFTYYTDVVELNPATGLGMTGADVNGGQVGVKVAA
jgi:hypothetical protein